MVRSTLKNLKEKYPHICYAVVLAYMPVKKDKTKDYSPDGLENVPRRFAVDRRNKRLVDMSDCVVVYVVRSCGGAAKFYGYAMKHKRLLQIYMRNCNFASHIVK